MKITNISYSEEAIELQTPFVTALRRTTHAKFIRLVLVCENGEQGIGEAPATKAITGEDLESIAQSVKRIKNKLIGLNIEEAFEFIHAKSELKSSARAMFDMALWDLHAKIKSTTVHELLGAQKLIHAKSAITISLGDESKMLEDAILACRDGHDILKLKLGSDIQHAKSITFKIAKELSHAKILIDANQAWDLAQSLEYIEAMSGVEIELIEQPVLACELESLKKITQNSHIPILADEAVFTLEDAKRVLENSAADMINIKLMKCGGITPALDILKYCQQQKIPVMLGSMLEGPNSIKAAYELYSAYPSVIRYLDLDSPLLYKKN